MAKKRKNNKIKNTQKWRKLAIDIKYKAGGYCELCHYQHGTKLLNVRLEVHHIKSANLYPELGYTPTNLICLCSKCHRGVEANSLRIYDDYGKPLNMYKILEGVAREREELY